MSTQFQKFLKTRFKLVSIVAWLDFMYEKNICTERKELLDFIHLMAFNMTNKQATIVNVRLQVCFGILYCCALFWLAMFRRKVEKRRKSIVGSLTRGRQLRLMQLRNLLRVQNFNTLKNGYKRNETNIRCYFFEHVKYFHGYSCMVYSSLN